MNRCIHFVECNNSLRRSRSRYYYGQCFHRSQVNMVNAAMAFIYVILKLVAYGLNC